MKLNKIQFKKILKECIRELIVEGAFNSAIKENTHYNNFHGNRPSANDFVSQENKSHAVGSLTPNDRLQEVTRIAAAQASNGDKKTAAMMESIFADTAMTTLQNQMATEGRVGGGQGLYVGSPDEEKTIKQDLAELDALSCGLGAKRWADIAFGKTSK